MAPFHGPSLDEVRRQLARGAERVVMGAGAPSLEVVKEAGGYFVYPIAWQGSFGVSPQDDGHGERRQAVFHAVDIDAVVQYLRDHWPGP